MKSIPYFGLMVLCSLNLLAANLAHAADAKTYQATGLVLEVTPTTVTIQKGDEKWQFKRDKATKVTGDLKVGDKATVTYRMAATDIDAIPAKTKK